MLRHPLLLRGLLGVCCIGIAVVFRNVRYLQHSASPVSLTKSSTHCRTESRRVNGTKFSNVWPNHTSLYDVWSHPEVNQSMTAMFWHPSNFSQLCASQGNLGPSFYAPPRYQMRDRPSGLRMIMTGDSIMRYTFIMLIHYLHTGHWLHDSMQPSLLRETSLAGDGGWPAFYRALERYFGQDSMICEGYRGKENWYLNMFENDYYRDHECLDNSITFFAKFSWGLRGYHTPHDINHWFHSRSNATNMAAPESIYEEGHYNWSYNDYDQFLRNVAAKLEPRPRVFVFNEGLWPGAVENLSNETLLRQIQDTIHELGMVSVYKTTTKYSHERTPGLVDYEGVCCQIFDHCLRMDWTACTPYGSYWDGCHFLAYVNLRTIEQLLDILQQEGMMPF